MNSQQLRRMEFETGFIAALDQSGGSTPRALELYGVPADSYSDDREMFDLMHEMRSRIVTSPAFGGGRILAAILFEDTLDRQFGGRDAADYLWSVKNILTILKVDKGLAEQVGGVRMMHPMPALDATLARARDKGVFGTKMRSVIKLADAAGVTRIVDQQFDIGQQIAACDLMPILEPEVDIFSAEKGPAEVLLKAALQDRLGLLGTGDRVMLKLTLPDVDGFYAELIEDPHVVRVAGLSGGYSREQATGLLARNPGMIASFSRALTEGLSAQQSDEEFEACLNDSIDSIFRASTARPVPLAG